MLHSEQGLSHPGKPIGVPGAKGFTASSCNCNFVGFAIDADKVEYSGDIAVRIIIL